MVLHYWVIHYQCAVIKAKVLLGLYNSVFCVPVQMNLLFSRRQLAARVLHPTEQPIVAFWACTSQCVARANQRVCILPERILDNSTLDRYYYT